MLRNGQGCRLIPQGPSVSQSRSSRLLDRSVRSRSSVRPTTYGRRILRDMSYVLRTVQAGRTRRPNVLVTSTCQYQSLESSTSTSTSQYQSLEQYQYQYLLSLLLFFFCILRVSSILPSPSSSSASVLLGLLNSFFSSSRVVESPQSILLPFFVLLADYCCKWNTWMTCRVGGHPGAKAIFSFLILATQCILMIVRV